ncbi:flagellin [Marinobacter nauticus]|uniref:flagellin N-terminal helical domain-containing protein n=1 Tax=Marinobacter nauticus TaxID=2743 RepID=UPI001C9A0FAC|nr:flagellin [Marinobacter nauticus]MBY5961378.1 flagellin [Marinobacter nauticus]
MALGINTNIASLSAQNQLSSSQKMNDQALERLSSGLRINSAKDDAAGLAISTRFQSQINGLDVAQRNANDGISLAQTAEGALDEITNNLQRIRDLSVQAANATNSASDRAALQAEVEARIEEIDRVASQTDFNGTKLLDGNFLSKQFQVGANVGQTIEIEEIASARTTDLGTYQGFNSTVTVANATAAASAKAVTVDGTTYNLGTITNDAKALASALNSAGIDGLEATANETTASGQAATVTGNAGDSDSLVLNGTTISLTNTGDAQGNLAAAAKAINAESSVTGVRAVQNGNALDLIAADGRNITTAFTGANGTVADYGIQADATVASTLDVSYVAPEGVSGAFTADANAQSAGFAASTTITSTGTAIADLDISTEAGANTALKAVDAALQSINSSRADLGAVQNRFESTISNIASTAENLSASNSRILDADFAAETAKLSKSQVLQQAGISVLAQANARPQQVLSLLQ